MRMKSMGLMLSALAMAGMGQDVNFDIPKQRTVRRGGFKHSSTPEKDRANTLKRLAINAKRKKQGLQPLRSATRFGGYKIPA